MENRYRFAHEIIQAVRLVVPKNRLITFRISNWGVADMDVSLFESKSEYQEMIKLLSREPLDVISVSTYNYKDNAFGTDQNMAQITREVTDLPLMICGQIYDRASAADALKHADIVLSGKSILLTSGTQSLSSTIQSSTFREMVIRRRLRTSVLQLPCFQLFPQLLASMRNKSLQ